jgi:hypothetical protein
VIEQVSHRAAANEPLPRVERTKLLDPCFRFNGSILPGDAESLSQGRRVVESGPAPKLPLTASFLRAANHRAIDIRRDIVAVGNQVTVQVAAGDPGGAQIVPLAA